MHEAVANHFSAITDEPLSTSEDWQTDSPKAKGVRFLVQRGGQHFSTVMPEDLLVVDANDDACTRSDAQGNPPAVEMTAWHIHGAIHREVERAKVIIHLHPHFTTAMSSLKDKRLPAIDQNTARFHGRRLIIDNEFDGMGLDEEALRLATLFRNNDKANSVILGNHGALVIGQTVAAAFDEMYYLEMSCRNYMTALSTGKELHVLTDAIAEKTAQQWEEANRLGADEAHLQAAIKILGQERQAAL